MSFTSAISHAKRTKRDMSIFDCISQIASTSNQDLRPTTTSEEEEIKEYLKINVIDRKSSPFVWWRSNNNKNIFPRLASHARKFLSAPATTIFSERLFSEAGNVFDTKRNRLLAERGEHLIFLHHNIPLLDFKH